MDHLITKPEVELFLLGSRAPKASSTAKRLSYPFYDVALLDQAALRPASPSSFFGRSIRIEVARRASNTLADK